MPFTDHGSEQPVPPYDNLRAVDWTRLLGFRQDRKGAR